MVVNRRSWHAWVVMPDGTPMQAEALSSFVFDPGQFWPTQDELPLELTDGQLAILDGIHDDQEVPDEVIEDLVLQGRQGELNADPWLMLFWLEAERALAQTAYRSARAQGEKSVLAFDPVMTVVEAVGARWPDHLVAELAWLYGLEAMSNPRSTTHEPEQVRTQALAAATNMDDQLARDAAIATLAGLDPQDLQLSKDEYRDWALAMTDAADPLYEHALARLAIASALSQGNQTEAVKWWPAYQRASGAVCDQKTSMWCSVVAAEKSSLGGWLGSLESDVALDWRARLHAEIQRCYPSGEAPPKSEGVLLWSNRWSAEPSADAHMDQTLRCVERAHLHGPADPLAVDVLVLNP